MFTRKMSMTNQCTHRQFYGQFVTSRLKNLVTNRFTVDRLAEAYSQDEHLNTIALKHWDNLVPLVPQAIDRDLWRAALEHKNPKTYPWSYSDGVCLLKEAAMQAIGL